MKEQPDVESALPFEANRCRRCSASATLLTLLTSVTKYFVCRRCDYRRQVSTIGTAGPPIRPG